MIVKNKFLNYSDTYIYQDDKFFCFSLDSILLANFVSKVHLKYKIVDLCSGNLPIPMVLIKRYNCIVDAVELQENVCELAKKNIDCNGLEKKCNIYNMDIMDFKKNVGTEVYDIVTVNPPYFKSSSNSKISANNEKAIARHEITTNIDDILMVSKCILKNGGKLYLISRTERMFEILEKANNNNLIPKRIRFIHKNYKSESHLFMLECIKNGNCGLIIEKPLFVYENDDYSKEVNEMFGE